MSVLHLQCLKSLLDADLLLHLQFATGSNASHPSQLQAPPLRLPAAYEHQPSMGNPQQSFGPNPFILQPGQPSLLAWPPQALYPGTATPGQELLSLASTAASTGSLGRTLGGQQQMLVPAVAQMPEASQVGHASVAGSTAFIDRASAESSFTAAASQAADQAHWVPGELYRLKILGCTWLLLERSVHQRPLSGDQDRSCWLALPDMCLQVSAAVWS